MHQGLIRLLGFEAFRLLDELIHRAERLPFVLRKGLAVLEVNYLGDLFISYGDAYFAVLARAAFTTPPLVNGICGWMLGRPRRFGTLKRVHLAGFCFAGRNRRRGFVAGTGRKRKGNQKGSRNRALKRNACPEDPLVARMVAEE